VIERTLSFEAALHSADAVQRAAYNLSDRLSCDLSSDPDAGTLRCTLHLPDAPDAELDALLADFRNEVLDETLRERVREQTHDVRNLILALAFSETGLVDAADA
jgi:His-Xaa-Ser system protein HxsD